MTSRNDFTSNEFKHSTRKNNLRAGQASYVLCPRHHGKLVDDWVELAGASSPSLDLIADHLAQQARFIGIDVSREVIRKCRELHQGKPAEWVRGDLVDLVLSRSPCLDNAGVINFDGFNSPGNPLEEALEVLGDFSSTRQREASHFLLIVNVTTDRKRSPNHTLRWIESTFPRYLTGEMPPDLSRCVYVSKSKPMVNVQVGFGFNPHQREDTEAA